MIAKVRSVTYALQLPSTSRIHPTFHGSQLKLFKGPLPQTISAFHDLSVHNQPLLLPVGILAPRIHTIYSRAIKQVLGQWSHSPMEDATWEDFHAFCKLYKQLDLEDKIRFEGGESDSNLSTGVDIGLSSEEIKKMLKDWAVGGLVSQEDAQMQEGQEKQLEAQAEDISNSRVDQIGEDIAERRIWVSSRINKKPAWMADFV